MSKRWGNAPVSRIRNTSAESALHLDRQMDQHVSSRFQRLVFNGNRVPGAVPEAFRQCALAAR